MARASAGCRLPISSSRSLVCDVLHYDRLTPTFVHSRACQLAPLAELRQDTARRISWSILFAKAYGLLSAACPELRQALMKWPRSHRYQHPHSIGTLVLSRFYRGEDRLFWLRLRRPETYSLQELQHNLERHQQQPPESCFERQLLVSRLPTPARRLAWWTTLHLSGSKRASRLGTFALTTLAGQGVEIERPPSFLTSTLTYGPLDEAGRCRVAIAYDHRIMDGLLIARALAKLEALLLGPISAELRQISVSRDGRMEAIVPRRTAVIRSSQL